MKTYSCIMFVLDDTGGKNGIKYGITANCRRYMYTFKAKNRLHAWLICKEVGVYFDGEVIAFNE